jgi:nucleoside-diphosphate-sugar epimerase
VSARVCVVTGASGYVGSRVAARFARGGWTVVPLRSRLGERSALEPADALVHCAYDFRHQDVNVGGTRLLLEAAREAGVRKVVHISSISAFEGARAQYGRVKLETERVAQPFGALVLRPGLVWGPRAGGAFGRLVKLVERSSVLPLVGGGSQRQFLVHEDDLADAICRYAEGELPHTATPVVTAHDRPWTMRAILEEIARAAGKRVSFFPVPWRLVWAGLRAAELARLPLAMRSDSVVSLVNQNPAPDFETARRLGIELRPFGL